MTQANTQDTGDTGTDTADNADTQNAAPDAVTAKAADAAKKDKAAGKSAAQVEDEAATAREKEAAALAKVKPKYYKSAHGGVLIDPDTQISFNGENAVKSKMTSWLKLQIDNGKIVEDTDE